MPYLKEGEEGEKDGMRDRALPSSQRQLPQRYHLQILKWSYERLIYTICWFGFIGQELLILGFWRTRIVDSTQIENQHSGRRMTFWKYTFPLCWSETTKWVTESTKWEYISTKWATETAKGVTETTKWESKKQQSGQRVLYPWHPAWHTFDPLTCQFFKSHRSSITTIFYFNFKPLHLQTIYVIRLEHSTQPILQV